MTDVKAFYRDETGAEKEGVFALRRLTADESTAIYDLCQRRNLRTGQTISYDETKFSKTRLATSILDCPITFQNRPWKDLDMGTKANLVGQRLDEDIFIYLIAELNKMRRFVNADENL